MTVAVAPLTRAFRYNGIKLPDIAGLSVEEVRDVYGAQYPELLTAEAILGEVKDGVQEVEFRRAVGTKG